MSHFKKNKWAIFFLFMFMIILTSCQQSEEPNGFSAFEESNNHQTITETYMILFKKEIDKTIITTLGGSIVDQMENLPLVTAIIPSEKIKSLSENPAIQAIEKNKVYNINPEEVINQEVEENPPKTFITSLTGKGIKIAVLDSGVERNHPDLKIAGGASFVEGSIDYSDDNGHGTHVTGIIGAQHNSTGINGIAPDATIYAVKVLDAEGFGYLSDIAAGIDWAINNNMDIINLSIGTNEESVTLSSMIKKAYNSGVFVVASAGNDGDLNGETDTIDYPGRYPETIAVGAVDKNAIRANFSATGPLLEVVAPGVAILSTYLNNEYAILSGTSMSTAYATGVLALIMETNPDASASKLRTILQETSKDIGPPGKDSLYGYGIVQIPYINQGLPTKEQEQLRGPRGEIGTIKIVRRINLWTRDENGKLAYVRVLNPGERYRVYSIEDKYGGQYGVGANYWITKMPDYVHYEPYTEKVEVMKGPRGEIGYVTITQGINLWKRDESDKLHYVRVLNPGERYRVYNIDSNFGGQFDVGANHWITKIQGYVTYEPFS
ncbi:S8 family peptidase [Cytobacillus suaedae]|nr:S8 family peptidase [Cytobacillus suaedae]